MGETAEDTISSCPNTFSALNNTVSDVGMLGIQVMVCHNEYLQEKICLLSKKVQDNVFKDSWHFKHPMMQCYNESDR